MNQISRFLILFIVTQMIDYDAVAPGFIDQACQVLINYFDSILYELYVGNFSMIVRWVNFSM